MNSPSDAPYLDNFRHAVLYLLVARDAYNFNEVLFVNNLESFSHQSFESEAALLCLRLHHLKCKLLAEIAVHELDLLILNHDLNLLSEEFADLQLRIV